jgi:hypothetical protein
VNQDEQMIDDLMLILGEVVVGPESLPRKLRRLDLALERAKEHQAARNPPRSPFGAGGSSSAPSETKEWLEDQRVTRLAMTDDAALRRLRKQLAETARDLRASVVRQTMTVDHSLLPADPGCRSCIRTAQVNKQNMGGHHADVYDKAKKHGLCVWCWKYARADAIDKGFKGVGELPPVEACDIYHTQGPRSAGMFLARLHREAERKNQKKAS